MNVEGYKLKYVEHPLIKSKKIEARIYQQIIFNTAIQANSLVVLPTGLGKTQIGIMLAAHRLSEFPELKILIMAPTRPLVLQHEESFKDAIDLPEYEFCVLTGKISPSERKKAWGKASIFFATPQTVERDIVSGGISLEDFSLVIFDEAHRAVGEYAYKFIAERYIELAENPHILGLTASPGSSKEMIGEVKSNLFIKEVEVRSESDSDVAPYIHSIEIERKMLELPEPLLKINVFLERQLKDYLRTLKDCGFINSIQKIGKRELLETQKRIRNEMRELSPNPPQRVYTGLMTQAAAFRIAHAIELLETQGLDSLCSYLDRLKDKAEKSGSPKAVQSLVNDSRMRKVFRLAESCRGRVDNPKLKEAKRVILDQLSRDPESKIIVFTHYRDSASQVADELSKIEGVKPEKFVGQSNRGRDKGLTQKEQAQIIRRFKDGETNLLVSTAVGEEGLDIPNVDLALFYEAVPSGIRSIQRRGRTGRRRPGRAVALLMKDTRDEAFYWAAVHKERRMRKILENKKEEEKVNKNQKTLKEFNDDEVKIIVDHREVSSKITRELSRLGIKVETQQLEVGDFILGERVCVERKTTDDFLSSLVSGRLFDQSRNLSENFERPVMVLEGDELYSKREIHPNAIRGALASIVIDYCIPIIPTENVKMTAKLLNMIARREQSGKEKEISVRGCRKAFTLNDKQRYVIEGLPGVSAVLAKRLLEHFKTVEGVLNAREKELQDIHGIGKEKSKEIRKVIESEYSLNE